MKTEKEENEQYLRAYAIERPNGSIFLRLFLSKDDAYKFVEEHYGDIWSRVQPKHKLRMIKVEVIKKKWRNA